MNTFLKLLLILSIAFFISCSNDDSNSNPAPRPGTQYADQNLQGNLFEETWMLRSGALVSSKSFVNTGNYLHVITLRSESDSNICSKTSDNAASFQFLAGEYYVKIFLETDDPLLEARFYEFADAGTEGAGAFYFYASDDTIITSQVGSSAGSMLITKVDTLTGIVEGSLVASDEDFNTNSSVEGKFTIDYCSP